MPGKPFDPEVLKQNRFYQLTLDLIWACRLAPIYDDGYKDDGQSAEVFHSGNAIVAMYGILCATSEFEPNDVITHVATVDFERWMASPESIAYIKKLEENQK